MSGGADFYCSVSGARYFNGTDEFLDDLSLWRFDETEDVETEDKNVSLSDGLRKGLHYSKDDVDASCRFVLLCPYEILEDGTMMKYTDHFDPHPTQYAESNITEIFNVFHGNNWDSGGYRDIDDGEALSVLPSGNNLIVTYTAYLILKQAAPEVKPHVLYALAYGGCRETMGNVAGIDYGPVGRIIAQYAHLGAIGDYIERGFENPMQFWKWLLKQEWRTDEDILHDAWNGPGNMWVFVRPDRFPVAETLAAEPIPRFPYLNSTDPTLQKRSTLGSLPPDLILVTCEFLPTRSINTLIATCRRFRSLILPHVNPISRRRIIEEEPWYLPAGPFKLTSTKRDGKGMHGREEVEWWAAQWSAGGISPGEMDDKIPWFAYWKECRKSMSMRNRKRIWGIARQLDALARAKGLL